MIKGVRSGENNGFQLLLDAEIYAFTMSKSSTDGFKIAFAHQQDIPLTNQDGFTIPPGEKIISILYNIGGTHQIKMRLNNLLRFC